LESLCDPLVLTSTAPSIVAKLSAEIIRILNVPQVREQLLKSGAEPAPGSPEELAKLIESEAAKWAKVIKALGLKLE